MRRLARLSFEWPWRDLPASSIHTRTRMHTGATGADAKFPSCAARPLRSLSFLADARSRVCLDSSVPARHTFANAIRSRLFQRQPAAEPSVRSIARASFPAARRPTARRDNLETDDAGSSRGHSNRGPARAQRSRRQDGDARSTSRAERGRTSATLQGSQTRPRLRSALGWG